MKIGHLRVQLPARTLVFSWQHPWIRSDILGLPGKVKVTQATMGELLSEGDRNKGIKPRISGLRSEQVKWPIYSLDGTPAWTTRFIPTRKQQKGGILFAPVKGSLKDRARKLTLRILLERSGLSEWERTQVWQAYRTLFHGAPAPQPTAPIRQPILLPPSSIEVRSAQTGLMIQVPNPVGGHSVISKQVSRPLGRVLPFNIPFGEVFHEKAC